MHLCKPEYGMERVYKHKFIKFELVLMYSLYAIFQFAKIASVSYFICYTGTLLKKNRDSFRETRGARRLFLDS